MTTKKDPQLKIKDTIILGDTVLEMRKLPSSSVDLIIADPPYNLSKGQEITFKNIDQNGFGGEWSKVMEGWDNMPLNHYLYFTYAWLTEAKRVLRKTGSIWIFGTYHNIGIINTLLQMTDMEIINEVVWYKRNAFPNLAGRRLTASHETLLWAHNTPRKRQYYFNYNLSKEYSDESDLLKQPGKQMRTVWDIPNNKKSEETQFGKHPTQKPLKVCRRIIAIASKPGDIILAPFSGSGSECVAAKELGRHYIGIENDAKYVELALKRLEQEKQSTLYAELY